MQFNNNETYLRDQRLTWPARAVVTAGMPYGNKPLHFGHIAGVFVPADAYARFLRDRIGSKNVRFISGTDCFGSPINEGYRKLVESGEFEGTINDYVARQPRCPEGHARRVRHQPVHLRGLGYRVMRARFISACPTSSSLVCTRTASFRSARPFSSTTRRLRRS